MSQPSIEFLSRFERNLNEALWATATVSGIYAFVQHVMLTDIPERFRGGAAIGDLLYDLAIAYIGAFVFYLLVVQRPLLRDRANIYQYLAPRFKRVYGEAFGLIADLNTLAGFEPRRDNTLPNIQTMCDAITASAASNMLMLEANGSTRKATVLELIGYHIQRARSVNGDIMKYAAYLDSEAARNIAEIDDCAFFNYFDATKTFMGNSALSPFSKPLFEYLRLVDRHAQYCRLTGLNAPSSSSLPHDDDAVPLSREIKDL